MTFNKETITGALGTIAALLGASCCIAPTLFVIFGVSLGSFGGTLSALEPYRWYFLAVGYVAVGYSIYSLYLKNLLKEKILKKPAIECACEEGRLNKVSKVLTWISLVLLIIATVYPYILPIILEV